MKSPTANPYFVYKAMKELKERHGELTQEEVEELKQRIALNSADAEAAVKYVDLSGDDWAHIYPTEPEEEKITTENAIDTFLDTYGNRNPKEDALLERLIFNPTPDYSQVLEKESGGEKAEPSSEQDALIDAFISQSAEYGGSTDEDDILAAIEQKPAESVERQEEEQAQETIAENAKPAKAGGSLSESLAKIYIKQGRYQRAYEIISDLNLNNPEKSVYFADQLRFLQKIIQLEERRKAATSHKIETETVD
jgi:hypothetical protein